MGGLRNICKMLGSMTVSNDTKTVRYVWDYVANKPVLDTEMPEGSDRWLRSEAKRWGDVTAATEEVKMTLPKLTRPEMARLVEIGACPISWLTRKPAAVRKLIEKKLVMPTADPWRVVIADLGRQVLAGVLEPPPLHAQDGGS